MFCRFITALAVLITGAAAAAQNTTTISSDRLEVDVSLDAPRILEYRLKQTGGRILGSVGQGTPSVVVSQRGGQRRAIAWSELTPTVTRTASAVVFSCTARIGQTVAATFDYAIRVAGNTVTIEMQNVREAEGHDLDEWLFARDPLIRVSADLSGARACAGDLGAAGIIAPAGQRLGGAARGGARGGEAVEQFHFGLVYTDAAAAGIYSNSLYRQGQKPVHVLVGDNWTGIFANNHRYSYKDENYEPFRCQIGIMPDVNGDGVIDWKDAAIFIHDVFPKRVKLRQDSIKYMHNHGMDFFDAPENVYRKICNMADGHIQMVLLSGWNGWGWDSEYPTWNQPGEEYGGREGLYHLHNNAHKYRAYTSMIHNFDDAYKNTRGWDESIIARRADGSLWNATWWSGGPSFIIGPYRFYKTGKMKETIDGLIAQGLERQIFSDVFTILPWRSDEDPVNGADAETNLVLGKFKLLDYLAEHDIYMNSEGFNYEMLGRYIGAHNGYNPGFSRDENRPPLANFICQGILAKKYFSPGDEGRFRGADTEVPTPFSPDNLYRWSMLISFYGEKPMRDFRVVPEGYFARYGDDVEVLWRQQTAGDRGRGGRGGGGADAGQAQVQLTAVARGGRGAGGGGVEVRFQGNMIADGRSVLLPKPDLGQRQWDVLRAFSSTGQTMRYPKPKNWTDMNQLTVMAMSYDHPPQIISRVNTFISGPSDIVPIQTATTERSMEIRRGPDAQRWVSVAFEGNELVIDIPRDQPIKLVYGLDLVPMEQVFIPLPPRNPITYPLEEVVERIGGSERPAWVRLKTRRNIELEPGVVLAVGASAVWPTREEATQHAANIVAKKMAWHVRQAYVNRAREAEKQVGATTDSLGYDNWQLGYDGAMALFTPERINARPGVQWYWERVRAGPERQEGWKAFVCVPCRGADAQQVFIESIKIRLSECQRQLERNPTGQQRARLELNVKVYERLLEAEAKRAPAALRFQV